jgi:hypothetical protein
MVRGPSHLRAGSLTSEPDIDHVCWSHDDPAQFREYAGEFLLAGVAGGACLHPRANTDAAPFHLHPATAGLDGIVIEGDDLIFLDHRSLLLQRYAEQHDLTAVVRTPSSVARRLAELLELNCVQVEVVV